MNLYFPTTHPKIQNTRKATFSYTYLIVCVQIGGKSLIACERVVSRGQSSVGRYEHFTR